MDDYYSFQYNFYSHNKFELSYVVDLRKLEQLPLVDTWSYCPLTLPTARTVQVKQVSGMVMDSAVSTY